MRSDAQIAVGSLGKLKAGQLGVQTDVVTKNLFDKYPNTDRIVVVEMMAATYCGMLRDSKTLKESEKIQRWSEFSDRVFKFQNPDYKPAPPKPSQGATSEHHAATERPTINNAPHGIANSGTINGNPTVNNNYGPKPVKCTISKASDAVAESSGAFRTEYQMTVDADSSVPSLAVQARSPTVQYVMIVSAGANTGSQAGATGTLTHQFNNLRPGTYTVAVWTKSKEDIEVMSGNTSRAFVPKG